MMAILSTLLYIKLDCITTV